MHKHFYLYKCKICSKCNFIHVYIKDTCIKFQRKIQQSCIPIQRPFLNSSNILSKYNKMPHIMVEFGVPTFDHYLHSITTHKYVPLEHHTLPYSSDSLPSESSAHPSCTSLSLSLSTHCDLEGTYNGHPDRVHTCLLQNTQPNSPKLLLLCCILIF